MKKRNLHPATPREQSTIKKIFRYLVRHSRDNITLTQIAEHCNTSLYFLKERYKYICSETIADKKKKIMLLQAMKAIIRKEKTIKQVCKENNFSSPAAFTRTFKTYFHITPTQYIRQKKK